MKHILPILTAALAFTAMTASAATTYTQDEFLAIQNYTNNFDKIEDSVLKDGKNGTYDFGSYEVTFEGNSKLRIHVNENIKLYVYDFVDTVGDGVNASALTGTAPGSGPVQQIGYRKIVANSDGTYVTTGKKTDENIHSLGVPTDTETVQRVTGTTQWNRREFDVVRNSYYLGEFKKDTDYELFVSYEPNGSDGQWSYTNTVGGYSIQADKLLMAYLSGDFQNFTDEAGELSKEYTYFVQVNNKSFGLRSETVGSPLPGGVQIALIAGLFGLGFWYVRRRKAITA